jgi:hypothetical protein
VSNLKRHLNPAIVISCVALFVALSGAAYAVSPIGKKAVKTQNLANGAVTTLKLRGGSVTTTKLRNLSVTGPKLGEASVTSTKLANGSVRSTALGGQVVTDGKIKNGAVTTEKLANGAVTSAKLSANAVETGKLENGSITAVKLSPAFLAQLVKDVSYVTKSSGAPDNTMVTKTATAQCPAGKKVIGGGAQIVGATTTVAVTNSAPPGDAVAMTTGPSSWVATATAIAAEANPWSVEAFAVCAEF